MQSYPARPLQLDVYSKLVLTAIALLLAVVAFRPVAQPSVASAASNDFSHFYVEPGTTTVRKPDGTQQVQGKVMIDMRTGDVWGFPTLTSLPYPVDAGRSKPPVSAPIYLGKFDLAKTATSLP